MILTPCANNYFLRLFYCVNRVTKAWNTANGLPSRYIRCLELIRNDDNPLPSIGKGVKGFDGRPGIKV